MMLIPFSCPGSPVADFSGNVLGVRNAPLNPSLLAKKSQFDPHSANTVYI